MINKEKIINKIKSSKFHSPGSGKGSIYHTIPIPGFELFTAKRTQNEKRLDILLKNYDFKGKTVLDIGCNLGYFDFKLEEKGAICYGLDYDKEAIEIATMLKEYTRRKNVHFVQGKLCESTISELISKAGHFDVIILFSVIHWLLYDLHDINKVVRLLRKLNYKKQVIFYEPSSAGLSPYPEQIKKKNVIKFLKNIGYTGIGKLGSNYGTNVKTNRDIWIGEIDYLKIVKYLYEKHIISQNNQSLLDKYYIKNIYNIILKKNIPSKILCKSEEKGRICILYDNYFVKIVPLAHVRLFSFMNEIRFNKLLEGKDITSFFYEFMDYKKHRFIFYERLNLHPLQKKRKSKFFIKIKFAPRLEKELFNILNVFMEEKIVHRDITAENILLKKDASEVKIVDFQWATFQNLEILTKNDFEKNELEKCLERTGGQYRLTGLKYLTFESDISSVRNILINLNLRNQLSRIKGIFVIVNRRILKFMLPKVIYRKLKIMYRQYIKL